MAAKKAPGTQIANWDQALADAADAAAAQEANVAAGQFFSVKSGVLSFNDAPLPGNQMAVIILDAVLENVYYEGDFDPDNPTGPTCFAFGRSDDAMAPHEVVVTAGLQQADACTGCPKNEWGTANKGKGKACRNTRRVAMISAGELDPKTNEFSAYEDAGYFQTAEVGYLKLPVTSVKGYAAFVKQVAGSLRRPPHGIFTKVRVIPDDKTQFKVLFEALASVPNELMQIVIDRNKEVASVIEFPYTLAEPAPEPPKGKAPPARRGKY